MRTYFLIWVGLSCGACAQAEGTRPPAAIAHRLPALAWLDGKPITATDLDADNQVRLQRLQDNAALREFALLWGAVDDAIADCSLAEEAQRRGLSLTTLLYQEINNRLAPPSDVDILGFYEANRDIIPLPYPQAAPILRQQMQRERAQTMRRSFADSLRQKRQVRYNLVPPPLHRVTVRAAGPSLGPDLAPVTLVLYSDFTCPYSAQARRVIKRLVELYPQTLRIIYQDLPLGVGPIAGATAQAAHCAWEQQQFWPFYDVLFDNNAKLQTADLPIYAKQVGLDVQQFDRCLASNRPQIAVTQSQTQAHHLGVRSTPTMLLNGMRLDGVLPLPLMQAFVDAELAAPKASPPHVKNFP